MIKIKNVQAEIYEKLLFYIEDFTFYDGKKYILTGENGAGKSTLLKSFIGINTFVKGSIENDKNIVYQAQNPFIFKKTPRDNFKIIGKNIKNIKKDLEFFAIENLLDQNIDSLSGGEKEKVVFLRTMLKANQTLLLDEPFSQMDKKSRIDANIFLDKWIKEKEDRMIIIISHDNLDDYSFDYHIELKNKQLKLI
ncbi:MAG: ATP-binding cassette domain-containing protein [Anaerococcus obesiensis]|uniref:ATP-binding cassette domain-containing protein n=1 Tax=Anaerococcus TaxID=165779 RepID=UPI002902F91A|nr:ATP-binding cassette domain-containing protein [Anaerococcus vaginalis]MDU0945313.1 ATP-binding cassette domain-containing protein [Anaerococcus vaginalis]MDU1029978.1 ATP-binding cassette domain-containing protein [Anaerococcus vaginalis]